tara:strand:- start:360 stop:647 length:288 start_codon:yes stop_codon:yes gene_type:complete
MSQKFLPKEILRIIKGYEYDILNTEEFVKKIKSILSLNISQPYYLRGTKEHKSDSGQIEFCLTQVIKPHWYKYISGNKIIEYIVEENEKCKYISW